LGCHRIAGTENGNHGGLESVQASVRGGLRSSGRRVAHLGLVLQCTQGSLSRRGALRRGLGKCVERRLDVALEGSELSRGGRCRSLSARYRDMIVHCVQVGADRHFGRLDCSPLSREAATKKVCKIRDGSAHGLHLGEEWPELECRGQRHLG